MLASSEYLARHKTRLKVMAVAWTKEQNQLDQSVLSRNLKSRIYFRELRGRSISDFEFNLQKTSTSRRPDLLLGEKQTKTIWICDTAKWPNGWVFVYEPSVCGFGSSCSHLNFRSQASFKQGVPWHSGNYRVWIHSETCTWHDKNIESNAPYR